MADLKTKPTTASVSAFIDGIADDQRRADCRTVLKIMRRATGATPVMWGPSIVGLGKYHYKYDSGREGDWFKVGFSPRKNDLTLYLMGGLHHHTAQLKKLGKHKAGKGCLYVRRLSDVDRGLLTEMIETSVQNLSQLVAEKKKASR